MTNSNSVGGQETVYQSSTPPTEIPSLKADELFDGRYRILKALGTGGMGATYLAKDQITQENIVVKVIHPALVDADTKQRMINEGVNTRKIKHANVVTVYDVKETDGLIYLTMEYIKAQPLRQWLSEKVSADIEIPLPQCVQIIQEILSGLSAVHATGLIHRDLKPENIMFEVSAETGEINLKIIDFGIATGLPNTATTTSSGPVGSSLYMAPEQRTTPDAVRPNADIFSVGRIFYELLMSAPFDGMWNPPSGTRSDVPVALDQVIHKSMQPPKGRYQSAADFSAAITESVQSDPLDSSGPSDSGFKFDISNFTDFSKTFKKHKKAVYISLAILFAIALLGEMVTDQTWTLDGGYVFEMSIIDGEITGTGEIPGIGIVTITGDPNTRYLQVLDQYGNLTGEIQGNLSAGSGGTDFVGVLTLQNGYGGNILFHIDHY